MKSLLFPLMSGIFMLPVNLHFDATAAPTTSTAAVVSNEKAAVLDLQQAGGYGRMACIAFKGQDYCRAELKDFDFDFKYSVVSATVYFSGGNFKDVKKGYLTSNSLKPIKGLMDQCVPGTNVVFDDVKVKGQDNEIRTIDGISLTLY